MKIALGIILYVAWFLYLGETRISFNPFSINIEEWHRPFFFTIILLSVTLLMAGEYVRGKKEGYDECITQFQERVDDLEKNYDKQIKELNKMVTEEYPELLKGE